VQELNILIMNSDPENNHRINICLKNLEQIEAVNFPGFPESLAYLDQHDVNLVLLDADNEQQPWIDVFQRIRTFNQEIKVVLMSRDGTDD